MSMYRETTTLFTAVQLVVCWTGIQGDGESNFSEVQFVNVIE